MKLFKSLKNCFTVLLLVAPFFSLAQYKFPIHRFGSYLRDKSRWEIGGTGTLAWGSFDGVTRITGYNGQYIADSTLTRSMKTGFGYGATVGIDVPFAASGHISLWAVSIHAMGSMYTWGGLNQTKSLDGVYSTPTNELTATSIQLGLPVGIDWKIGCDAINSQRLKYGATLGAGAFPHINITSLSPDTAGKVVLPQQNIGINPYIKAEVSAYPRTLIKLRFLYTLGNVELMNTKVDIPGYTDGPFKLYYKSSFMVSLIWQPFSSRWSEYSWDNTYDTYNWNERLN